MKDRIDYSPPFGIQGIDLFNNAIHANLYQLFDYRHHILKNDIILWKLVHMYQISFWLGKSPIPTYAREYPTNFDHIRG